MEVVKINGKPSLTMASKQEMMNIATLTEKALMKSSIISAMGPCR